MWGYGAVVHKCGGMVQLCISVGGCAAVVHKCGWVWGVVQLCISVGVWCSCA